MRNEFQGTPFVGPDDVVARLAEFERDLHWPGPRRTLAEVEVFGVPVTQGSTRLRTSRDGSPYITHDRARELADWRGTLGWHVRAAARGVRWDGAVATAAVFYLPRVGKPAQKRLLPTVKPDLDKLVRAANDALTVSQVITDDARIVESMESKRYVSAAGSDGPRLVLRVDALAASEGELPRGL